MKVFFDPRSYKIANGKWVPKFHKITRGYPTKIQENGFGDKQFDTKEEANKYVIEYCLQQGYVQV
ncbi:MAG: hypothetical protein Q7U36_01820 [bacterium]|nr:hypothetical protein [bacterium]